MLNIDAQSILAVLQPSECVVLLVVGPESGTQNGMADGMKRV